MPYLSPPTLTDAEQRTLLAVTASHPRDHLIFSVALGTGLRLGEIVGLNVGDMYFPDGTPRTRIRLRPEIAKGGRAGDVFVPDALIPKLARFWTYKAGRRESLEPVGPLFCNQGRRRIASTAPPATSSSPSGSPGTRARSPPRSIPIPRTRNSWRVSGPCPADLAA